jgi:hypothetical protein
MQVRPELLRSDCFRKTGRNSVTWGGGIGDREEIRRTNFLSVPNFPPRSLQRIQKREE